MNKDFSRLHLSSVQTDEGFLHSSPKARIWVTADRRDLDWFCYEAKLEFNFPDGVAEMIVEFSEQGLRSLGEQMLKAALAIRTHRIENPEAEE